MGLKQRLTEKNAERARGLWKEIVLPDSQERVLLKALTGGEHLACIRIGQEATGALAIDVYTQALIAYGAHDPDEKDALGNPTRIWNFETMDDRRNLSANTTDDLMAMADEVKSLSGVGDDSGKASGADSPPTTSIIALPSISPAA